MEKCKFLKFEANLTEKLSLTPAVKILSIYIENWRLWYVLSELNFWEIMIWDNCFFVHFRGFFGYKTQKFLDIHARLSHNVYFVSLQQYSNEFCKKNVFSNFASNLPTKYLIELLKLKSLKCHISVNFYRIFKYFAPFWSGKNALSNEYPFGQLGVLF